MSASLVGTALDRYTLTALLGEGALGAVYRAYDAKLEREVAVRVLPPRLVERRDLQEQFLQEVRTAVRLRHPHLVRVLDFGQLSPHVYLVSDFLPGAPLGRLLKTVAAGGTWPPLSEALRIARDLGQALGQLHQRGLLHHAVHAGNVLLRAEPGEALPYQPVLADVGLGRLRESGPVTEATLYLSPEHAQGQPLSARSDLFGLGLILYELAAGRPPFALAPGLEAARVNFAAPVTSPRAFRPDLPEPVERLILQALALNPDERFPDAAALGAALDAALPEALSLETQPVGVGSESGLLAAHQLSLAEPPLTSAQPTSGGAPETLAGAAPPAVEPDRIQILDPDHRSRTVLMKPGGLTIGRDPESDIVIDHPKVSRHHARIDYDGVAYRVTDLKSTNGTLLNNVPVLPDVPQPWTPEAPLRIGDSWLRLELAGAAALAATSRAAIVRADGSAVDPAQVQFSPGAGLVGLYVDTPRLSVLPGGSAIATLFLLNQGPAEDRFLITVEGVPPTWLATMPGAIRMPPGGQQEVRLVFQPPRAPSSRAGRHVVRLRVVSQSAPDQAAESRLTLAVGAFSQFAAELRPERLRPRGQGRVTIENQGNAAETYQLALSDPEGALRFTPHEAKVKVESGEAASLDFRVAPRRTRLIGREEAYPYMAQVSAPDGQKRSLNGQAAVGAALPPWAPVALAGLLLLGLAGAVAAAIWLTQPEPGAEATRLAAAAQQTAGVAQTAFFNLTRTAVWLEADDDGDGLSNRRELETGTSPTTFDSDGDGWSDGEERNVRGTDPLDPDTDDDGVQDSLDPDPGTAPTATITPTSTATATTTPLPSSTPDLTGTALVPLQTSTAAAVQTVLAQLPAQTATAVAIQTANANQTANAVASRTAAALLVPSVSLSFSPAAITAGTTGQINIVLTNSNVTALVGVGFNLDLPSGLQVPSPPASSQCNGAVSVTAARVTLSGGSLPGGGNCTVTVSVSSSTAGAYPVSMPIGAVTTTNGGSNTTAANATLNVTARPTVGLASASASANEGDGSVTLAVTLSGTSSAPVTVDYTISGGATNPASGVTGACPGSPTGSQDFVQETGQLTFAVGSTVPQNLLRVTICNDNLGEADETVRVTLSNPSANATLGTSAATLTILANDTPTVGFSSATYSANEGDGTATINVTLSNPASANVTVNFAATDGTATGVSGSCPGSPTAVQDYVTASGTLSFSPGDTSEAFTINICNDTGDEPNETVNLTLSSPSANATLGTSLATLSIADNDPPAISFQSSVFSVNEGDGTAVITVILSSSSSGSVTVDFAAANGATVPAIGVTPPPPTCPASPTDTQDYVIVSGTLTFLPGDTSETFSINICDDGNDEMNETVSLTLSNPNANATLGASAATLTLVDDDP